MPHASPFGDRVHTSVGVSSGTSSRPGARKKLRADAEQWPCPPWNCIACRPRTRCGAAFSALPDAQLVKVVSGAVKVGVDSPFGWPEPFVVAASKFAAGATWPPDDVLGLDRFALRHTDLVVKKRLGLRPLAVAADRPLPGAIRLACVPVAVRLGGPAFNYVP